MQKPPRYPRGGFLFGKPRFRVGGPRLGLIESPSTSAVDACKNGNGTAMTMQSQLLGFGQPTRWRYVSARRRRGSSNRATRQKHGTLATMSSR
jgi:hypothetical protein